MKKKICDMKLTLGDPVKGVCKQCAIWVEYEPGKLAPLIYFQKPKWVGQDDFNTFLHYIRMQIIGSIEIEVPE